MKAICHSARGCNVSTKIFAPTPLLLLLLLPSFTTSLLTPVRLNTPPPVAACLDGSHYVNRPPPPAHILLSFVYALSGLTVSKINSKPLVKV